METPILRDAFQHFLFNGLQLLPYFFTFTAVLLSTWQLFLVNEKSFSFPFLCHFFCVLAGIFSSMNCIFVSFEIEAAPVSGVARGGNYSPYLAFEDISLDLITESKCKRVSRYLGAAAVYPLNFCWLCSW